LRPLRFPQSAFPIAAFDFAGDLPDFGARVDDLVFQTLMIAFPVVAGKELFDGVSQRVLAEENQPRQTFIFQASHKPFQIRIQIGALRRQDQRFDIRLFEYRTERFAEVPRRPTNRIR